MRPDTADTCSCIRKLHIRNAFLCTFFLSKSLSLNAAQFHETASQFGEFHPDLTWNYGALGFFWRRLPQGEQETEEEDGDDDENDDKDE